MSKSVYLIEADLDAEKLEDILKEIDKNSCIKQLRYSSFHEYDFALDNALYYSTMENV